VIKSISDLASTAFLLSVALKENIVPNSDNVVLCLSLEDAEKVHESCVSIAPGSDRIKVPVLNRNPNAIFPAYRTFEMEKPGVPERTGEPWLVFFEIEVFVV
jgi:hypothetical protein